MRAWAPVSFIVVPLFRWACVAVGVSRIGPEIEKTPRDGRSVGARSAMWARAYVTSTRISGRVLRSLMTPLFCHGHRRGTTRPATGGRTATRRTPGRTHAVPVSHALAPNGHSRMPGVSCPGPTRRTSLR